MKLVMTLLVRNERDILRENLEFHLAAGVDEVILMDNRSEDSTAEIAHEYERAGVLRYLFQPRDDYAQNLWVTEMARCAAAERGADWVINSDADEFWWAPGGSIKEHLATAPTSARVFSVPRTNFVARSEDGRPWWRRMDVRHVVSTNVLGRPLGPKAMHRALARVTVAPGNHSVRVGWRPVRHHPSPLTILHFPIRSREQFFTKVAEGGAAVTRNTMVGPSVWDTWRHLYGLLQAGRLDEAFAAELRDDAEVADGIAAGTLVRDRRLVEALRFLPAAARDLAS
ncbi:MAG: hypothetical protein QOE38_819 [Thermoleophilaceae bacterium]|nr:hypothetical protein [Thermoleophilaceae bacterium]